MNTITTQYLTFCGKQENNRAFWSGLAIMVQANVLAPFTLVSMDTYHGGDWQLATCVICFFCVLIPILSAQPVKIGISTFFLSVLVHCFIITFNVLS